MGMDVKTSTISLDEIKRKQMHLKYVVSKSPGFLEYLMERYLHKEISERLVLRQMFMGRPNERICHKIRRAFVEINCRIEH